MAFPRARGRPCRSSLISGIKEGEASDGKYKCTDCLRNFPRKKSLQAHSRTHTGEKPYQCTYPGCEMSFRQSGHLRYHNYRHTGEKPYICPAEGCEVRFTHPNRQCTQHPYLKISRDNKETLREDFENLTADELKWFKDYKENQANKRNSMVKRKFSTTSDDLSCEDGEHRMCATNNEDAGERPYKRRKVSDSSSGSDHLLYQVPQPIVSTGNKDTDELLYEVSKHDINHNDRVNQLSTSNQDATNHVSVPNRVNGFDHFGVTNADGPKPQESGYKTKSNSNFPDPGDDVYNAAEILMSFSSRPVFKNYTNVYAH